MKLTLAPTPAWRSCYPPTFVLPARMRWLHPDALLAIAPLADRLVFSDVFRSPEASLAAARAKRGVMRPGWSAHNFGLAVDLDLQASMLALGGAGKAELDLQMKAAGWQCYRSDGKLGPEAWHYTWRADGPGAAAIERVIQRYYGREFALSDERVQEALRALGLYRGALDGDIGPLSRAALRVLQRGWDLSVTSVPDINTQRMLAVLTAEMPAASRQGG